MTLISRRDFLIILGWGFIFGFIVATVGYDILDIDFGMPKEKEEVLLKYSNGNFTLYPEDEYHENFVLPSNTKLNISIIKLSEYDNMSFVNLTIPEGMPYQYMRGFISTRKNQDIILSWRGN